jgi:hypothetical protein
MFSAASYTLSLAFITHRSFPGVARAKLVLFTALLILAGCGGSGNGNWQQVQGDGFVYNAPSEWTVEGAAATDGGVGRVEVLVFRLVRSYDPQRRAATARELDRVAAGIAGQQNGSVTARRALQVAGLDARSYTIRFDGKAEQITFVLQDRREYELLCRRDVSGDDAPCAELLTSFQLR